MIEGGKLNVCPPILIICLPLKNATTEERSNLCNRITVTCCRIGKKDGAKMSVKFVVIGSGSQFTEFFLQELFKYEEFKGCRLALVDRRPARLKHEVELAETLSRSVGWDITVQGHTERKEALEGATFVYCFIAVNQRETWKKEFELANKHGVYPLEAYTAGAPGLGMAIRHVPVMLDICEDIERICPDAWFIMENNPLTKMAAAVERHTNVKYVAYCFGHELVQMALEQLLEMTDRDPATRAADPVEREFMVPAGNIELTLAGINHCAWLLDIRSTETGKDLYPRLRKCLEKPELYPEGYRYSIEICKRFGLFPSPADNHLADYLWCTDQSVHKWMGLGPYPVDEWFGNRDANAWEKIAASIKDEKSARQFISRRRCGWFNLRIASYMMKSQPSYFPAVNVVNNGAISNLPADIIVEVPGLISPDSVKAVQVGPLPEQIAPICALHGWINNLAGDAAATGSKEKALQALLLDPFVHSMTTAKKLLDDILDYNRKYDTRFS